MDFSKYVLPSIACAVLASCAGQKNPDQDLTHYVDPYIGTGGHGHVFMGVNLPFGAIQVGPTNFYQDWDWCSGYHYSDTTIVGFGQTHLSGTGIGDLGDLALMPVTGDVTMNARGKRGDYSTNFHSYYSHDNEEAKIGYYAVTLDRYDIKAELTATPRVAYHRYTFPENDNSGIIIDLRNGIGWDRPENASVRLVNDSTIVGYRHSSGWAVDQQLYFTAVFSKPISSLKIYKDQELLEGTAAEGEAFYARASFDTKADEQVSVKVAISPVSIENSGLNLTTELPDRKSVV